MQDRLEGAGEAAVPLYSRAVEPAGAEYTALGSKASHSRGAASRAERMAEIFRLEEWRKRLRAEEALARCSFAQRMDQLLKFCIGRDEQAAAAARTIEVLSEGVVWLGGKPGMGKSAFMAKLAREYFQKGPDGNASRTDLICVLYFFLVLTESVAEQMHTPLRHAACQSVFA